MMTNTLIYTALPGSTRSAAGMRGLEGAELGGAMVSLDKLGSSGFLAGASISTNCITPNGGTISRAFELEPAQSSLARNDTVLAPGAPSKELKSLLGNGQGARLKSGAALKTAHTDERVALEHAKSKARVELDLVLESNVCVQGGVISGYLCVNIRPRTKNERDIMISRGKLRLVGFESLGGEHDRHVFYQAAVPMSDASERSDMILDSQEDLDGFAYAKEGDHIMPFTMQVPLEGDVGNSKGVLDANSGGASVRYIVMITIKVRDPSTDARSIAHFYRDCEVWPRLNPSAVLAPSPRPLTATAAKTLFMGGSGKVQITASIHRVHWIAGQQCYVKVRIINDSKKTVKRLNFSLVRTLVAFKPKKHEEDDPDACSTTTYEKQVAETTLEMCESGGRGHASAKGWWTGVMSGEDKTFSQFILLPPDALTILRGRLLEVDYHLRVSVSSGSLSSDVNVKLPLTIINFLSVDPPPSDWPSISISRRSSASSAPMLAYDCSSDSRPASRNDNHGQNATSDADVCLPPTRAHARPALPGMFQLSSLQESDEEGSQEVHSRDFATVRGTHAHENTTAADSSTGDSVERMYGSEEDQLDDRLTRSPLANLCMRDDSDDVVQYAVSSVPQQYLDKTSAEDAHRPPAQEDQDPHDDDPDGMVPYTRTYTNVYPPGGSTFSDLYYESDRKALMAALEKEAELELAAEARLSEDPSSADNDMGTARRPLPRVAPMPQPDPVAHAHTVDPSRHSDCDTQPQARRHSCSQAIPARPGGARDRMVGRHAFAQRVQEKLQARGVGVEGTESQRPVDVVAHGFEELPDEPRGRSGYPGQRISVGRATGLPALGNTLTACSSATSRSFTDAVEETAGEEDGSYVRHATEEYQEEHTPTTSLMYAIQPSQPVGQAVYRQVSPSASHAAETHVLHATEARVPRMLPNPPTSTAPLRISALDPSLSTTAIPPAASADAAISRVESSQGRPRSCTTSDVPSRPAAVPQTSASPQKIALPQTPAGSPQKMALLQTPTASPSKTSSPQKAGLSSVQQRIRQLEERTRAAAES